MSKDAPTPRSPLEETKEYHVRYLRAINHPLRRKILRVLKEEDTAIEGLQVKTGLDTKTLKWHLSILMNARCIKEESKGDMIIYKLTQEGKVIDYVDR